MTAGLAPRPLSTRVPGQVHPVRLGLAAEFSTARGNSATINLVPQEIDLPDMLIRLDKHLHQLDERLAAIEADVSHVREMADDAAAAYAASPIGKFASWRKVKAPDGPAT